MSARTATDAAEAGAALLAFLDARVVALVEQIGRAPLDPLVRSDKLGPQNRIILGLIGRGELSGVKIGGRYHVRASEWARYTRELEERQRTGAVTPVDDVDEEADRVLADLGLKRKASAGRGRR